MADAKPGERYTCASCGTQVVVIKADGTSPRCCGADMEPTPTAKRAAAG
jgi:desulfoferrodoxin